ncbi:MAG: InlB B-repeat-containing protein [Paludibacteraceae bacterium]|nr:InlB B-repeat-containing protein [Paludibacteraceae bacterium]
MAHDKAKAASRFYTPQRKADVPEWMQMFDKKEQPKPAAQKKFKSGAVYATSGSRSNQSAGITTTLPSMQFRSSFGSARASISVSSPKSVSPAGSSATMTIKETSRASVHTIGASGNMSSAVSNGSTGSQMSSPNQSYSGALAISTPAITYKPFHPAAPSEYDAEGNVAEESVPERRKTLGGGPEWGEGPCPVGEPWILAIFAAMFSGIIAWRKRTTTKKQRILNTTDMKNFVRVNRTFKGVLTNLSRSLKHIALALMLLTLGVGNVWGDTNISFSGGYIYFADTYNVHKGVTQLCGRKSNCSGGDWYTAVTTLSNISHTKLYYTNSLEGSGWSNVCWNGWALISNSTAKGNSGTEYWSGSNSTWYSAYDSYGLNSGSTYLITVASASKGAAKTTTYNSGGYSSLNNSQTVYKYTSTNNGSTYSAASINSGTVTISAYKMTGNGTASNSSNSTTINTAATTSASRDAAYTGEVTLTASANSGYVFVGWFENTSTSTPLSTETTYTYNAPNSTKSVYARFKNETTYTITIANSVNASTSTTNVGATPVQITAPAIAGYTFTTWSAMPTGVTKTSGNLTDQSIYISATKAATVTANYTEDLSSPYVLKGGSAFGGTAWETEFALTKKTGHSTESAAYYTASLTATPDGAQTSYNFKIVKKGASDTWYGLTGDGDWWYMRSTDPNQALSTSGNNIQLRADVAGNYEIKVDYTTPASPTITITYPTLYTLTYAIGTLKGTSGSISTSPTTASGSSVVSGNSVTLTAPAAKAGYTWKGWYTNEAGTTGHIADVNRAITVTMNANKTLYACYQSASYTVTLNKQTTATGYGTSGSVGNQTVYYNTTLPSLSGSTMPTGTGGYGFMGFYTATGGGGVRVIDASGNWVNGVAGYTSADGKWIMTGGTTLFAYYCTPKITAITLTPASGIVAPGGEISATPTIEPTVAGDKSICWKLLYGNGNLYDPQPSMSVVSNTVTFNMPAASGSYKLAAILHTGTGDCGSGTELDSVTANLQVAGDHNVTVEYKCGSEVIQASEVVTGRPLDWTSITAPTIFGYTFSKWKAGDGITIKDADGNGEKASATINFKAIYEGKLTAIYTQKELIYFKNTLGWSSVYVNFCNENYWGYDAERLKGSGNAGITRNKLMTHIDGTDIWYYDYGTAGITPTHYISFTEDQQGDEVNGYQWFWETEVVYPSRYADDYDAEKVGENGFYAKTPMFVPTASQSEWKLNNNGTNYYNAGYWTKYTPGTGYTLEVYRTVDAVNVLVRSVPFTSADDLMPMTATLDLEENTQYKFQIKRDGDDSDDVYYGNSGEMTYNDHGQSTPWEMTNSPSFDLARIYTNTAGDYTFHLNYTTNSAGQQYRLRVNVDYPIASGDYRIIYKDGVHTKWHPSAIIPKVNNGKDTVSFFIRPNTSPTIKIQQATVDGESGAISWSAGTDITSSVTTGLTKDSVYNINLTMNGSGEISVESVVPYTGNYYIRTDCANSKWDNYRSDPDHLMTYSEYSITHGGYSHYYCHWVETNDRKNVKFTIANDYSPCISDTLARETATGAWAKVASFITEGGDLLRNANVRFMWDQHTNTISRAYIDGAQGFANDFLVLVSADSKIANINDASDILTEVKFSDNQNWIYESNVKAQPNAQIKLRSTWGVAPTTIVQYFKGTETTTETLITGSGTEWYDMRLLYDFKTNRLVAAMVPSGNYDAVTPIHADVMFIRDHQGDIAQITFTDPGEITNIETAYAVLQFNKWTLNNKERTGSHNPLASPASKHERDLYFISFPFRVKLSEVFGFGTYGQHWAIQYYDGAERAANGYWQGDPGFWKFYWDRKNVYLEPNQGYLLALDLELLTEESSVWANNTERAELFFPSYTALGSITNEEVTNTLPSHACTINRAATEGLPDTPDNPHTSYNRTIFDSHWNVMSVPTYVNTNALSFANTTWTTATVDHKTQGPNFLYTWNMDDNTLTPTSGASFKYHAMHAYMVQYYGNVSWKTAQGPAPIVARKTYAETPKDVEFCLEIQEGDKMLDRTFVRFSDDDEVSADFAFNEDMSKDMNGRKANIYTLTADNVAVAGNTMPKNDHTISIPVNVKTRETNSFTFSIPEGTNGVGVTLVDKETGDRTILSAADYTVTLGEGMYSGRFELEISPIKNTPTGVDETETGEQKAATRKMLIDGQLYIIRDEKVFDARGIRVQ